MCEDRGVCAAGLLQRACEFGQAVEAMLVVNRAGEVEDCGRPTRGGEGNGRRGAAEDLVKGRRELPEPRLTSSEADRSQPILRPNSSRFVGLLVGQKEIEP